jgi:hypothetical protein
MRMLDFEKKVSVWNLHLYLTVEEAREMCQELEKLLQSPEAKEHFHILSRDSGREISCSVITPNKLKDISGYTKLEQQILLEK